MTTRFAPWLCLLSLLGPGSATAQTAQAALPDPTRAPPGMGAAASAPAAAEALVLQSVRLRGGRPSAAVISGQLVELGQRVGELRLAQVNEHSVTLTGAQGSTTLQLTPEAQKRTQARQK